MQNQEVNMFSNWHFFKGSLLETSKYNGFRLVKLVTTLNVTRKSTAFP